MEKLLVISDEPALALALADELPDRTIIAARVNEAKGKLAPDICLIIAERGKEGEAENIALSDVNIPQLLISRPVRLRELLYTIEERLQAKTLPENEETPLEGGYSFSPRERMLISADTTERIQLTEKESELFGILLKADNEIIHREQLLKQVWGYSDAIDTHTLETHVYRLRGKLRQIEAGYDILSSPEGGYSLKRVE